VIAAGGKPGRVFGQWRRGDQAENLAIEGAVVNHTPSLFD
jgi:hypothetical protein